MGWFAVNTTFNWEIGLLCFIDYRLAAVACVERHDFSP